MTRSKLREHIFKALFQAEFYSREEMPEQLGLYLDALAPGSDGDEDLPERNEVVSGEDEEYIRKKTADILEKLPDIDEAIDSRSSGWKTGRIGKVELTVLRLAVYELLYDEEIPKGVAIDQAVELAKMFGGEQSPAFVNGVLAKFAR